jgi:hypothetical protein
MDIYIYRYFISDEKCGSFVMNWLVNFILVRFLEKGDFCFIVFLA